MIALLQKTRILASSMLQRMRNGEAPSVTRALPDIVKFLNGRRFGAPLTQLRAAVLGQPIGGKRGNDIQLTFEEVLADLSLLYDALIQLTSRTVDIYDVFSVRRDRLALNLSQFRIRVGTLLGQQSAANRDSIVDSFHTLDLIDPDRTTCHIDLDEGVATLPPDASRSVLYDGSRVQVLRTTAPPGAVLVGPPFSAVFTPYRLDAWYTSILTGTEYIVDVNVTGLDYEHGASEEVPINAVRIDPTGPIHLQIEWSPDGFNWHALAPEVKATIRGVQTFHFAPVSLGYLRFHLRHSEEIEASDPHQLRPIGIKRIELMSRGWSNHASLYSKQLVLADVVHTVVAELQVTKPFGTQINSYLAQDPDGPWIPLAGSPVSFDAVNPVEVAVDPNSLQEETTASPATMWTTAINAALPPLPETGELIAGRGQVQLSAFPFDWKQMGDVSHIPEASDWIDPPGEVRSGDFLSIGDLAGLTSTAFRDGKSPLGTDTRSGSYGVLAILQGDGNFVLQPGYTYRLQASVWCSAPVTLDNQGLGVVNPAGEGGSGGILIAPLSLFVNGRKVYQRDTGTTTLADLSTSAFQTTVALQQGLNQIELHVQLLKDLSAGQNGLATAGVYVYFQPNLFSTNLVQDLGIDYIQAYPASWRRYSEFDLRYNVPLWKRESWAWKLDVDTGKYTDVLLNHDPTNSANRGSLHPSYQTIDGVSAGFPTNLLLRYPTAKAEAVNFLYFRAEFLQDQSATSPPQLRQYKLLVN